MKRGVCMQIVGPHHASALEAFPAAAGVADRQAAAPHYMGSPGAGVEGAQQWQAPEPAPVDPRDATGPGKRKVPWEGDNTKSRAPSVGYNAAWFDMCALLMNLRDLARQRAVFAHTRQQTTDQTSQAGQYSEKGKQDWWIQLNIQHVRAHLRQLCYRICVAINQSSNQ